MRRCRIYADLKARFAVVRSGEITDRQAVAAMETLRKDMATFRSAHFRTMAADELTDLATSETYLSNRIAGARMLSDHQRGPIHFPKPDYEDED